MNLRESYESQAYVRVKDTQRIEHQVEIHGWDCQAQTWYGPHELDGLVPGSQRILEALRKTQGSWYGRHRSRLPGEAPLEFHTTVHDLGDCGMACIDLEGSAGGPIEIVAVIPQHRFPRIRSEFAFGLAAFLQFVGGPANSGAELPMHDHVERVIAETKGTKSLVFSIENRFVLPGVDLLVSGHVEKLSLSMITWMQEKDSAGA